MTKEEIMKKYAPTKDNVLYILHDIQDNAEFHYLTKEDMIAVSKYLEVPLSYIEGVVGFYSMFSKKQRGRNIVRLCQSPPCHLMGEENIKTKLEKTLNIKMGETTKDSMFTLEFTSCLGVCGVAPAMMINNDVYGNLTPDKIEKTIDSLRRAK